jgi:hypothetical protein
VLQSAGGRKQEAAFRSQGRYPDGFCPGGTAEHSPVIDRWEQEEEVKKLRS